MVAPVAAWVTRQVVGARYGAQAARGRLRRREPICRRSSRRGSGANTLIDRPPAVVMMLKDRPLPVRLWLAYCMYRRYFGPWQALHAAFFVGR